MGVSQFNFYWDDVQLNWTDTFYTDNAAWQQAANVFNQTFVQIFPQLANSVPFTTYTIPDVGIGSRLEGGGDTTYDKNGVINAIQEIATNAGFSGDANKLHVEVIPYSDIQSGSQFSNTPTSVNPMRLGTPATDLANATKQVLSDPLGIGISTPVLLCVAAGMYILLNRK